MFSYYETRYTRKYVTGCGAQCRTFSLLGHNVIQNEASRKTRNVEFRRDINSGNVECKITSVIVYAATTFPKVEISGRNSTDVLRRNVDIGNVRDSLMCVTRNSQWGKENIFQDGACLLNRFTRSFHAKKKLINSFIVINQLDAQLFFLYSQTSVHERLGSRTIRFTNKFSQHKASRMTYCVSSYEHASRQNVDKNKSHWITF